VHRWGAAANAAWPFHDGAVNFLCDGVASAAVPLDLADLLDPTHTAVLTMELQRGVVGDAATIRDLAEEVEALGVIDNAARIAGAARRTGARVVHCTAEFRPDRAGSVDNSPMLRAIAKGHPHLLIGSTEAELVPALGPEPSDIIAARTHGLTPFPGTDLDQTLRNIGVRTIVATGVSVNIGITGMVMVAVDLGYRVVVITDAVAGVPRDYTDAVIKHTLAPLETRMTTEELIAHWSETPS
jgi:nicotinamidase-related amidase